MKTLQEIIARLAEIQQDIEKRGATLDEDMLAALTKETDELLARKAELIARNESRAGLLKRIADGNAPGATTLYTFPESNAPTPAARAADKAEPADPYDTVEYRNAFMHFFKDGTPIPAELRATTTTTDVQAVIPTTTLNEIIRELKEYGNLYNAVRKLNVQGGLQVPILSLMPTASWIGETASSADQKVTAKDKVSFTYHGIEVKIAQSLVASVTTYSAFQDLLVPLAAEAIVARVEADIINGDGNGKVLGVTKDTRIVPTQVITMTEAKFTSWVEWKKAVFAKMKLRYRGGNFYMAAGTFDGYIDGMVDAQGQPIGRVNYGIDSAASQRFGGKPVVLVEDDVIAAFDTAAAGDVVAVFFDPQHYAINSNMQMTTIRWTDHDTNEVKDKVIMIVDGKLLDAAGVLIIKKG